MAVQPHQSQVIGGEYPAHRGHRRAAGHRQPELLVFVCGGDELVRVRLDPDSETNVDVLDDAGLARDGIEALDFGDRVQDDVPDTDFDRRGQFRDGFVVAVEGNPLRREASVQRDGELAAGGHIEREPFLVDPAGNLAAQEGLGRVAHVVAAAKGGRELAAPGTEVVLVDDEQRGAVLLSELGQRDSGEAGDTGFVANDVVRPHIRRKPQQLVGRLRSRRAIGVPGLFGVPRAGRVYVHIRSGAVTPSIASPLAITWRVA